MNELPPAATAMNFSWIESETLAGCRGPRTDDDLAALVKLGVRGLVRLAPENESGLTAGDVAKHGLADCYEPVPDFTPPSQTQLHRVVAFITDSLSRHHPVAVSCGAGYGRTGTVLACYLVSRGLTPREAITELIARRPCSQEVLEVPDQEQAIYAFQW